MGVVTNDPAMQLHLEAPDREVLSSVVRWFFGGDAIAYERDLPTPAATSPRVRAEMRELLRATAAQRDVVRKRLSALVDARFDEVPGAIARAAEAIGTTRPNVYRLLDRMEEMGPVSALVPQNRRARRPSIARDGFGQPIDGWIEDVLKRDPEAPIAEIDRVVRANAADLAPQGSTLEPPATSSLKRRVHALRASLASKADDPPLIGREILIDSCRINIDLGRAVGPARVTVPGMVVAIDERAKVVIGFGLWFEGVEEGYEALALDVARRLPALVDSRARIAQAFETVRWVVPPELQSRADQIGSDLPASRRPRFGLVPHGDRRSGARLVSLIGDRIGDIMLLVRPSGDDGGPRRTHVRQMHGAPNLAAATYIVSTAVEEWNAARLAGLTPGIGGAVAAARRNASALSGDFARMLASVLT